MMMNPILEQLRNDLRFGGRALSEITVYVAMSGGVDSSVVAAIVKEAGFKTIGVTMCFNITHPNSSKPSCCGIEGIDDARRAAQILDIPHYVFNFAEVIDDKIINDFTSEYLKGRTPNPCARCNQHLKFGTLYDKVMSLGADYLATGHYAKIHYNGDTTKFEMKTGDDPRKDQSYFLYSMPNKTLAKVLFPLGDLTKDQVRAIAAKYQLNTANKPESQDICFVPDSGYKKFIVDRCGEQVMTPGDFIGEQGEIVGQHKGIANYTIGQREQLGIALGYRVYVNRIDPDRNTVHIGRLSRLYSSGLKADQLNLLSLDFSKETIEVMVRIRYNAPAIKARLTCLDNQTIEVEFYEPQRAVTPGQSVVFYDGDVVLGGAIISEAVECTEEHIERSFAETEVASESI